MKYRLALVVIVGLTSGCDPVSTFNGEPARMLAPASGTAEVAADGSIETTLTELYAGQELDAAGNGYSYVLGNYSDALGAGAFSGLTEATDLGAVPTIGIATLTGDYSVARLDGLALNDADELAWTSESKLTEEITLTADFDAETLTGAQNDIAINGTFNSGALAGTVTYFGLDGTLSGEIGTTQAVGSFSGGDANTVFAGGFFVTQDE